MARKKNDNLLMDDDLTSAFFGPDEPEDDLTAQDQVGTNINEQDPIDEEELPGQLAVDVYETQVELVIKARTAGVTKDNIDVSISEGILTISGTLSSGDDLDASKWHIQECYWGEFSRTLSLPVQVKEDEAKATLKDGVLTISFPKIQQEAAKRIEIM